MPDQTPGISGCTYIGSVEVAGTGGTQLAALVNQTRTFDQNDPEALGTYTGLAG